MIRNLIPWRKKIKNEITPFGTDMNADVDRFFNSLLLSPYDRLQRGRLLPSINVMDGEKNISVEVELPGVNSKDIDISLSGRRLSIKAQRKAEKKEDRRDFHRMEISYGSYSRTIALPGDVDPSSVDAIYKNGVLRIELKKSKTSKANKIKIKG